MLIKHRLDLQLFAGEGATAGSASGEGSGEATSGDNATAAAEQRLRELGVPEDKIRKRASKRIAAMMTPAEEPEKQTETEAVSAPAEVEKPTEETKAPARMTWDQIMADPEYNKEMQATMKARLKTAKTAEDTLSKIAKECGLDPKTFDHEALLTAVRDAKGYYEDKALEMGVPKETAMHIDQLERDAERRKVEEQQTIEERRVRDHITKLETQAQAMKTVFPNFDLRTELQNPVFARLTHPSVGLSVEDAYYAIHRNEIQAATMQATAQQTAQKLSNAIQSGSKRPNEAGTSSQAPSVTTFNYRTASKAQRDALKAQIRAAAARGEKVYPGQYRG